MKVASIISSHTLQALIKRPFFLIRYIFMIACVYDCLGFAGPLDAQCPSSHRSIIPAVISIMSSNGLTFPHSAVLNNSRGFKVTQRVCVIDWDPRNGGEHFAQVVLGACATWNAFTLPEGTLQYRVHSSSVCQTLCAILVFRGICFPVWIPIWPLSFQVSGFIPHPLFSFLLL